MSESETFCKFTWTYSHLRWFLFFFFLYFTFILYILTEIHPKATSFECILLLVHWIHDGTDPVLRLLHSG